MLSSSPLLERYWQLGHTYRLWFESIHPAMYLWTAIWSLRSRSTNVFTVEPHGGSLKHSPTRLRSTRGAYKAVNVAIEDRITNLSHSLEPLSHQLKYCSLKESAAPIKGPRLSDAMKLTIFVASLLGLAAAAPAPAAAPANEVDSLQAREAVSGRVGAAVIGLFGRIRQGGS